MRESPGGIAIASVMVGATGCIGELIFNLCEGVIDMYLNILLFPA